MLRHAALGALGAVLAALSGPPELLAVSASVVEFDPLNLFEGEGHVEGADLLVFVERGKRLGRSPFDKTLRALDGEETNLDPGAAGAGGGAAALARSRPLVVASCRGCEFFEMLMDRWRLSEEELPVALLFPNHQEMSGRGKFRLDLAGDGEPLKALIDFVQRFDRGELRPWVRGPPPPPPPEAGAFDSETAAATASAVAEAVGSTFLEEVVDPDADVVVMFYAPFCGFSKLLKPGFEAVARRFGGGSHVRFARIDTTVNELPPSDWIGEVEQHRVPRVYLFPRGKKTSPVVFPPESDKSPAALLAWLEEHLPSEVFSRQSGELPEPAEDEF